MQDNENAITPTGGTESPISVYQRVTAVDNSAVYEAQFNAVAGLTVTESNIERAKVVAKKLGHLLKIVRDPRMTVQRAIKATKTGEFAFAKGELEKAVEAEQKRVKDAIDAVEHEANRRLLNEAVMDHWCLVRGTQADINKLAAWAGENGVHFEDHGPAAPEGDAQGIML